MNTFSQRGTPSSVFDSMRGGFSRRSLLKLFGAGAGAAALAGCGGSGTSATSTAIDSTPAGPPDAAAAAKEGTLTVWHGLQSADAATFFKGFTDATGIQVNQQTVLPGDAMPKFQAEFRAGVSEVDVFQSSDVGALEQLRRGGHLMRYESAEAASYPAELQSEIKGFWTAFYVVLQPMMYNTNELKDAPKSYADLLTGGFTKNIGVQTSEAGSQYAWWYALRDVLDDSFWPAFEKQQPRAYKSSTLMVTDILRGQLRIGAKVSSFQYVKSAAKGEPLGVVFPTEGTPGNYPVVGIIKTTKRPNAAKILIDYMLSEAGQASLSEIQGSFPARPGVKAKALESLPPLTEIKSLFVPTTSQIDDYASTARHQEFVTLWNKITGFA